MLSRFEISVISHEILTVSTNLRNGTERKAVLAHFDEFRKIGILRNQAFRSVPFRRLVGTVITGSITGSYKTWTGLSVDLGNCAWFLCN